MSVFPKLKCANETDIKSMRVYIAISLRSYMMTDQVYCRYLLVYCRYVQVLLRLRAGFFCRYVLVYCRNVLVYCRFVLI